MRQAIVLGFTWGLFHALFMFVAVLLLFPGYGTKTLHKVPTSSRRSVHSPPSTNAGSGAAI